MSSSLQAVFAVVSIATVYVGNGIVLAAVVGMAAFAWRQGLFVTTVVALGCLAAFVGALASVGAVSRHLLDLEVPAAFVPAAAYAIVLAGLLLMVRGACGRWLPEQALWMGGLGVRLAACGVGGIAGAMLAAAALIGWTMLPLPAKLALKSDELFWDPGPWALKIFARCAASTPAGRDTILGTAAEGGRPGLLQHYRLASWREVDAAVPPEGEDLEARGREEE